jgi:hypothetical protein
MDDSPQTSGGVARKTRRRANPKKLAPIDVHDTAGAQKTRKAFQKKDLIEAVRRLTPQQSSHSGQGASLLMQKSGGLVSPQAGW